MIWKEATCFLLDFGRNTHLRCAKYLQIAWQRILFARKGTTTQKSARKEYRIPKVNFQLLFHDKSTFRSNARKLYIGILPLLLILIEIYRD